MPLGEFIGEVVLRGFLEVVLYAITYYTGVIVLGVLTLGQLRIAPLHTLQEQNHRKKRGTDWSLWLDRPMQGRLLKADIACIVGFLFWLLVGVGCYLAFTNGTDDRKEADSTELSPKAASDGRRGN